MEKKWAVIVAVVLGLLAVLLTNVYFSQKEAKMRQEEAAVLVAARDIAEGAVIEYDMLTFEPIPVKFIQPGAMGNKQAAVGKTAIAAIMAGEQILATKLTSPGTSLTLAGKTPAGKRAFTIGMEAAFAVGGMIRPGDHVDVLSVFTSPPITVTLFQDILILAVGQEMIPEQEGTRGRRVEEAVSATRRESITLALTPQEVQVLTIAMEQGKIRLTLRPEMEAGIAIPQVDLSRLPAAMDLNTLLQYYIRPVNQGPQVEVIRGLTKEITTVPK